MSPITKIILVGCLASLVGCASLDLNQIAPPPMTGASPTLVQGRTIYVTRCAKCHAVEPVKKYSREQWKTIIPDMAEETKLSPSETAAVAAYVHSILDG